MPTYALYVYSVLVYTAVPDLHVYKVTRYWLLAFRPTCGHMKYKLLKAHVFQDSRSRFRAIFATDYYYSVTLIFPDICGGALNDCTRT